MIKTRSTTQRILIVLGAVLCFSSCGGIQNAINPAGPQANNLSRLWWLMFTICSVVFVIVMIALLWSLRNRTRESVSELKKQIEQPREQERRRRNVVISAATI